MISDPMTAAVPDPTVEARLVKVLASRLDRHLSERDFEQGCRLACGYDGDDRSEHIAEDLVATLTARAAAPDALRVRLYVALVEQRVIDSRHYGEAPYAPITWADVNRALLEDGAR